MSKYTDQPEAATRAAAPLTLGKAKALAEQFATVSHRSVISKAQSMGLEYVKAAPAVGHHAALQRPTFSRDSHRDASPHAR